jgi:hypothetical protein
MFAWSKQTVINVSLATSSCITVLAFACVRADTIYASCAVQAVVIRALKDVHITPLTGEACSTRARKAGQAIHAHTVAATALLFVAPVDGALTMRPRKPSGTTARTVDGIYARAMPAACLTDTPINVAEITSPSRLTRTHERVMQICTSTVHAAGIRRTVVNLLSAPFASPTTLALAGIVEVSIDA